VPPDRTLGFATTGGSPSQSVAANERGDSSETANPEPLKAEARHKGRATTFRLSRGTLWIWTIQSISQLGTKIQALIRGTGKRVPATDRRALAQPRNTRAMPTDQRRRDDIAAAVAANNQTNPDAPLPRNAARLLMVMFPSEDVCQRSQAAIAAEGFSRDGLPAVLRRLVEAGLLSRHRVAGVPDTYRLHLPGGEGAQ
jgi:hypothetical protein